MAASFAEGIKTLRGALIAADLDAQGWTVTPKLLSAGAVNLRH